MYLRNVAPRRPDVEVIGWISGSGPLSCDHVTADGGRYHPAVPPPGPSWARRPLVACAVLLAAYLALSLLNDPRAYLGTDTGGKVATLEVMTDRGRLDPDIGYWAEEWDPGGRVHPLYYTSKVGDRWVNVTTLPMLYAGYPLYRLGGYRLMVLVPMLGSVLAALAARAVVRRTSGSDGWPAFWIVGLASPLTVYALDFWEHSVGVAAMAWGVVVLLGIVEGHRSAAWGLAAGALFGLAATMRTEALVYGFVATAAACAVIWLARPTVAASSAALAPRLAATATAAATASADVGADRLLEAGVYTVGMHARLDTESVLLGLALLGLLGYVAVRATRTGDAGPAAVALAGAAFLYVLRFAAGPGFVPGLFAAAPVAVVGALRGWSTPAGRYVVAVALLALPIVNATQFQGGAAPQWGARYVLVSGLLLTAVGAGVLGGLRAWAQRGLVAMAVAVTAFGLMWMSVRTHAFGSALQWLHDRPEPVLVSRITHMAREGGVFYGERRWLTAETDADQSFAVRVLEQAGVDRFGLVTRGASPDEPDSIPGWRIEGQDSMPLVSGIDLYVTTYQALRP